MIVNKKLDRFKQWAGERMGGEVKTNTSDNFKVLETEMNLRHEGMDRLHQSMSAYVKSMSKRSEGADKDKNLPVGHLGATMVAHGEDFERDSEFGSCLIMMGRANERIARTQESYVAQSTTSWLEGLERSLAQMKEYQTARRKLESRRLAYDTSLAKMQKQKREDFRVEEELRSQKAKYEESSEDVYRRMEDIKEAEAENIADLTAFLEAELSYYDRCREILLQLKSDWPAGTSGDRDPRKAPRSRSNTTRNYSDRYESPVEEEPEPRPSIPRLQTRATSSYHDDYHRPSPERVMSFQGPTSRDRDMSPVAMPRLSRVPTEPTAIVAHRAALRPAKTRGADPYYDDAAAAGAVVEPPFHRSVSSSREMSPAPSIGSLSRNASWSSTDLHTSNGMKKAPPPPPPSRAKKPPPPPPPAKRNVFV